MINKAHVKWDNIMALARFAECFLLLDSGLRRNDGLMGFLGLIFLCGMYIKRDQIEQFLVAHFGQHQFRAAFQHIFYKTLL